MVLRKRVLLAFGEASGGMSAYNYTSDGNIIFPPGSLAKNADVSLAPGAQSSGRNHEQNYKGRIGDGCLYNPHDYSVNKTLNKWWYSPLLSAHGDPLTGTAISNHPEDDRHSSSLNYSTQLAADMIDCGVSLLVNSTLSETTANTHPGNYLDIVKSSIWLWADREPSSAGSASTLEDGRCAALDLTKEGQWRARDCSFHFYGACRVDNKPYSWVLTDKRVAYDDVAKHCPNGSSFSVPRTPLESTYLYAHALAQPRKILGIDDDDATKHSIWVDFNSIDVAQCWVVGHGIGRETKCPYHIDEHGITRKHVIVPTVAAIIALAITALMMLVKCNVNRRNSRRKRVIEGWEYEGVPA
ncbi:hypothetical protein KEM54_001635 [Ascosphaera aggregata]|nr:hypothetical protein KEM54_001635 [Ascosphaera aggregata]